VNRRLVVARGAVTLKRSALRSPSREHAEFGRAGPASLMALPYCRRSAPEVVLLMMLTTRVAFRAVLRHGTSHDFDAVMSFNGSVFRSKKESTLFEKNANGATACPSPARACTFR